MSTASVTGKGNRTFWQRVIKDFKANKFKYIIALPVVIYLFLFAYRPMYGVIIAFKDYRPSLGIWGSPWVGLKHFRAFLTDVYFVRLLKNTVIISLLGVIFGFPAPIIFALLLNEIRSTGYKRTIQTITYMPHFISTVVICGIISSFSLSQGAFNDIIAFFGGARSSLLANPQFFRPIYILSGIWQNLGWNSIIYLAALSNVDQEQYEAARIDGASRFQQAIHVTIPAIMPTIIMLFILRMGSLLNVGYEKILLLYQPTTYEVADVISTYVYRKGLLEGGWSFSTAVSLFNSVINIFFLVGTNALSRKVSDIAMF